MKRPAKSKQLKPASGSQREQERSAQANDKNRNPDVRASSRQARISRQPGVRAEKAHEEDELGERAKGGDFPDARLNRPAARHGQR